MWKSLGLSRCRSEMFVSASVLTCLLALASCGGDDQEKEASSATAAHAVDAKPADKKASRSVPTPTHAPEPVNAGDSELLRPYQVGNLAAPLALVKVSGQPDIQGVLVQGATAESGSGRSYVLICGPPEGTESVTLAFKSSSGLGFSSAKKISELPSGLSVFGFSTSSHVRTCRIEEPQQGDTFHAIRVSGDGKLTDEEMATQQQQLRVVRERIAEAQGKLDEARRPPARARMVPPQQRGGSRDTFHQMQQMRSQHMQDMQAAMRELSAAQTEERRLVLGMEAGIASLKAEEVAAFSARDIKPKDTAVVEDTMLVSSSGIVVALRAKGGWVNLKDEVETSGKMIREAKISVSGSQQQVNVSCELHPFLPTTSAKFVMVAETTHGLETQGGGSIEERLSRVEPMTFQSSGSHFRVQKQVEWAGTKTKLWIKVFDPEDTGKLILDEVIALDYPGMLSARWDKEPSSLISIPAAEPDQPENLVAAKKTLDAKGTILDIVAAGDGSVVAVRTDREPFWALLDLKTGKWLPAPWKATERTLVATQAGKIHLVDRESMVVETWGLESGRREGFQIIQTTDPILAIAAPLSDADQPLLVATAKGAWFLGAKDFEPIPSTLDTRRFYSEGQYAGDKQPPLDPASISVRANSDGSLYFLSGSRSGTTGRGPERILVSVDRTPMVVRHENDGYIGTKGRDIVRNLPDHGGRGLSVSPSSSGARFPESTGEIRLNHSGMGGMIGRICNPPVLPDNTGKSSGPLPADRTTYLDSASGALLLPDGATLHYLGLNLPEIPESGSAFLLAGEAFEIPLPPGTGHRLASTGGDDGTCEITGTHARWIAPSAEREQHHRLKLEWTGELGSPISSDHNVRVVPGMDPVVVESPDGSRKLELPLRGILSNLDNHRITGFAGSGAIMLCGSGDPSAWNLWTCERIFSSTENFNRFFGDADHLYTLTHQKIFTSYDIRTGAKITEVTLGAEVQSVATGMASRAPLLAVEQNNRGEGYLLEISRDTLKPQIVDLPVELRRNLFAPSLEVNATGSAAWTRSVGIFRDDRAITVTPFPPDTAHRISSGVPDISGKFIVDSRQILHIAEKPPKLISIPAIPGLENATQTEFDATGRYILLRGGRNGEPTRIISVRAVADPSRELFRIRYRGQNPVLAAGAKALLVWPPFGSSSAYVHELDVAAIAKQLAN